MEARKIRSEGIELTVSRRRFQHKDEARLRRSEGQKREIEKEQRRQTRN